MKKKILVTGGAGFIGTHLVKRLAEEGYSVTVLDLNPPEQIKKEVTYIQGDVRNRETLVPLIQNVDVVFHLAAVVSVPICEKDPVGSYETNTTSTKIILELIAEANQKRELANKIRIIFSSSSAVYGDLGNNREKISEFVKLPEPVSHYGAQKLASEKLILKAHEESGIPAVVFRFFNVYGPGQKSDSPYSGVISLFSRKISEKSPLLLNGGGTQTRDFVSVHDVVQALVRAAETIHPLALNGEAMNLGTGKAIQIKELAEMLMQVAGTQVELMTAPAREGDILHSCANIQLAKRQLDWTPLIDLSQGLDGVLNQYVEPSPIMKKFRFYHFQTFVFFMVALLWMSVVYLMQGSAISFALILCFSFFATALLFWMLYGLDYFHSYHPIPKPDSMLTLIAVTPFASCMGKYLTHLCFRIAVLRYREILLLSPLIAILIYLLQFVSGIIFVRSGLKRKICLLTTQEQGQRVAQTFRNLGLLKYYEFIDGFALSQNPLRDDLECMVISRSEVQHFYNQEGLVQAMIDGKEIIDYGELINQLNGRLDLEHLNLWMFLNESVRKEILGRIYYLWKTAFERVLSFLALILLLPLFLLVGIFIKISSPGPVFYGQIRWGFKEKEFCLWKFRSMRIDAEAAGAQWSTANDPRVTRVGAFLRKTRIDELPQLWNVVRGEMSLIGPRPERPEFYRKLESEIPLFRFRLLVRPGITGWAQVMGGYASTVAETKRKLEYDLYYLNRMSPKMDFIISVKTISVALRALGSLFPG